MEKERLIRAIGGGDKLSQAVETEIDACILIQDGLPYHAIEFIVETKRMTKKELDTFIAKRTLARRKVEKKLSAEESDVIARLALIFDFAEEVFGNDEKARKWLRTPNRALQGHLPIELLRSDYGARVVETVLGRIQHGVYS